MVPFFCNELAIKLDVKQNLNKNHVSPGTLSCGQDLNSMFSVSNIQNRGMRRTRFVAAAIGRMPEGQYF